MAVKKAEEQATLKDGRPLVQAELRLGSLSTIARLVLREWPEANSLNHPAGAYLLPMLSLEKLTDTFGYDDARSIVVYALSNMTSWRGPVARMIKEELKFRLKAKG